jgi:MerR family transcriptional regulator, copper efflux regulator
MFAGMNTLSDNLSSVARGGRPTGRTIPRARDYSIGLAAKASGVSAKMIRYYESTGLIRPASRSASNYRTYDDTAIQTLRFIARARLLGFSMEEISNLLALWQEPGRSSADVKALALAHAADLGKRIAALQSMKAVVEKLAEHCHGDSRPDCPILDELSGESDGEANPRRRRHV